MIIISDKTGEISVKIPNNLKKTNETTKIILRNTETKKLYEIDFEDESENDHYFIFNLDISNLSKGEYEYSIGDNKGLLRIGETITKKIYDEGITFKTYE